GRQPVPARNQLGEFAGGGLPRAFLGLALAHGGQRDARSVARALSDLAGASWPLSGAQPFGVLLAQHAPAGRGPAAASWNSRWSARCAAMAATSSSRPTITSTRSIFFYYTGCWRNRLR